MLLTKGPPSKNTVGFATPTLVDSPSSLFVLKMEGALAIAVFTFSIVLRRLLTLWIPQEKLSRLLRSFPSTSRISVVSPG
jgi:hypothetical protein